MNEQRDEQHRYKALKALSAGTTASMLAGQVIRDVIGMLKELLENGLDSKGRNIRVTCGEHATEFIEVMDDGAGIEKESLRLMCRFGGTSKISGYEDIEEVSGYGFRGEGLAAIRQTSDIEVHSRPADCATGHRAYFSADRPEPEVSEARCSAGTTVRVLKPFLRDKLRRDDLIRNCKAYFKAQVDYLHTYALIRPDVKLEFHHFLNGKNSCVFSYSKEATVLSRITDIFGLEFSGHIDRREAEEGPVRLTAYLSNVITSGTFNRASAIKRCELRLVVNGKPADMPSSFKAIVDKLYTEYNKSAKYFVLFFLTVPNSWVDFNLSKDKREVLIRNKDTVKKLVFDLLSKSLDDVVEKQKVIESSTFKPLVDLLPARLSQSLRQQTQSQADLPVASQRTSVQTAPLTRLPRIEEELSQPLQSPSNSSRPDPPALTKPPFTFVEKPTSDGGNPRRLLSTGLDAAGRQKSHQLASREHSTSPPSEFHIREVAPKLEEPEAPRQAHRFLHSLRELPSVYRPQKQRETAAADHKPIYAFFKTKSREDHSIDGLASSANLKRSQPVAEAGSCCDSEPSLEAAGDVLAPDFGGEDSLLHKLTRKVKREEGAAGWLDEQPRPSAEAWTANPIRSTLLRRIRASMLERDQEKFLKANFGQLRVVGQFNKGFIICKWKEQDGRYFVVDQHAADEKANYERLIDQLQMSTQMLLAPIAVELSVSDFLLVEAKLEVFERNGFKLRLGSEAGQSAGHSVLILGVPHIFKWTYDKKDFMELLYLVQHHGSYLEDILLPRLKREVATKACNSSIVVGSPLDRPAMHRVVKKLSQLHHPWNCPHGRPSTIIADRINEPLLDRKQLVAQLRTTF